MTGTKARIAIAVCALALAAGSAQVASGEAGEADTLPHADAAAAKAASRGAAQHCPTRRVSARAGVTRRISIRCRLPEQKRANRVDRAPARIADRPDEGRILAVDRDRNMVRYRARPGFVGRDRFVVVRRSHGVTWRTVVRVSVIKEGPLAPPANPNCITEAKTATNYQTPVDLTVACTGNDVAPLKVVATTPSHGTLRNPVPGGGGQRRTLTVTYVPNKLYVGGDKVEFEAKEPGSRTAVPAEIEVLPWRMRALGDSATAGFGFLGGANGEEMKDFDGCEPIEPLNDRCSSNSEVPEDSTGPLSWSPDFGLKNKVSWAAQFAKKWQGGGHITAPVMFQNRAVTGSTPADWLLPTGQLHGWLTTIIDEDPDLIAFTLGVNPLLDKILEEGKELICIRDSKKFEDVAKCLKSVFEEVMLPKRLKEIYEALLGAEDAEVVTFQYHLATPLVALAFFKPWQVEALITYLNAEIAAAVAAAKAALPAKAGRLTLIEAQVDPSKPDPLKVPRFNLGIPPVTAQGWKATKCPTNSALVDGRSHQAMSVQTSFRSKYKTNFCEGEAWVISTDYGLHPNRAGYAQFANALYNVAVKYGLVPTLP